MHKVPHTPEAKQRISASLKEQRSNGITDLHKHKISETKRNEIEKVKAYYNELEKTNKIQQYDSNF